MDSDDNLRAGEQMFKKEKFQNLDDFLKLRDEQKSRIPIELRIQTQNTCNDLDQIIRQKKDKANNNTKLLRALIDGDMAVNEDEDVLEDPLTSNLEKKRRRILNEFEQSIK